MKNKLFLTLVALAALFTACSKDGADQVNLNNETISATLFHESVSRTALNDLQVVWSNADAITVFTSYWGEYPNNKGILISGAGTTSANFNLILEGTEKVAAVYPYQEDATFDGRVVSLTMPAEYDHADSDISGAPMAALFDNNSSNIVFKNAGALLAVTVNNIPAGYNQAILTATGASIAGDCQINFDNDGVPTLTAVSGEEQITINFDAANEPNKTFYFPIPVANYPELVFSISNGTETKVLKTKALNAERNMRYRTDITLNTVTGETSSYVAVVANYGEFIEAIADANISEIKFADDIAIVKNQVAITRNLTFDLNGCTISGVCNTGQDHLFMVGNGATLNVKDSSNAQEGKITFASGASTTGWTIDVCGTLNLYSGTLELTGNWSIGYVADVRPNAWGSAYTAPTTFNMYGGKVISSDAAVRVASSSSSGFTNISANFNMYDGEIDADWDGIFIQQSDAIYDILNVLVSGGTIKADKFPVRLYGPIGTSVIGGGKVATTLTISGGIFGKSTDTATSLIEGMLYYGGGIGNNVENLPYTKISVSGCTCGGENINFAFDSTNLE